MPESLLGMTEKGIPPWGNGKQVEQDQFHPQHWKEDNPGFEMGSPSQGSRLGPAIRSSQLSETI